MNRQIVYIDNDSLDPYFSFGLEYYLTTEKCFEDKTVFLFWRTSPTLMVGKYQNTIEEINTAYAEEKDINIVRRMSGGGTIYTDQGGWQYSFITKTDNSEISFSEYISPVIDALEDIGIKAEFNGRNDLVIDGRKISGTAQYRHNGYTVHHGSLLYDTSIEEMVRSTTVDEYKIISKGIKSVKERVTNISEYIKYPLGINAFKELVVKHIMGDDGQIYKLSKHDVERIKYFAKDKFDNWECKFGKNPSCSISRKGHYAGGSIEVNLDVVKGKITSVSIFGDFFANIDKKTLEGYLEGCEYSRGAVIEKLKRERFEEDVYKISVEEVAECIFGN